MNKEEILRIAREKYSIGTKYFALDSKTICEITGDLKWGDTNNIYGVNWGINGSYNNNSNVYNNRKWAEIVSTPNKIYELW